MTFKVQDDIALLLNLLNVASHARAVLIACRLYGRRKQQASKH
jgi:hypothetical protein